MQWLRQKKKDDNCAIGLYFLVVLSRARTKTDFNQNLLNFLTSPWTYKTFSSLYFRFSSHIETKKKCLFSLFCSSLWCFLLGQTASNKMTIVMPVVGFLCRHIFLTSIKKQSSVAMSKKRARFRLLLTVSAIFAGFTTQFWTNIV